MKKEDINKFIEEIANLRKKVDELESRNKELQIEAEKSKATTQEARLASQDYERKIRLLEQ